MRAVAAVQSSVSRNENHDGKDDLVTETPEQPQVSEIAETKTPMETTEPDVQQIPAATPEKAKSSDTVTFSRNTFNALVIGATFLVIGLVIGALAFGNGGGVDEAAVRAIVRDVLEESGTDLKEDMAIMVDDDPYIGPEDAPIVIVEFSAYACPYCGRHFEQTFEPLLENYGQHIRYVYRDFPTINPDVSFPASMAANCAAEQGQFWEYHDMLFSNQELLSVDYLTVAASQLNLDMDSFSECLADQRYYSEVENDFYDASVLGVSGTPSFYINGEFYSGAQAYEFFERVIQRELDRAGIAY